MRIMKKDKIKFMCLAGVFTALVFVVTAYLHIPINNGYIHIGDGIIYLAACLLPLPYGLAVGAGGALLADCLTGFAIWAPASVIIKALTTLLFSSKKDKIINLRNSLVLIPAAILCVGGYYLYEALIYGNFTAPLFSIPSNITQSIASSIFFVVVGITMDKMNVKSKLNEGKRL